MIIIIIITNLYTGCTFQHKNAVINMKLVMDIQETHKKSEYSQSGCSKLSVLVQFLSFKQKKNMRIFYSAHLQIFHTGGNSNIYTRKTENIAKQ